MRALRPKLFEMNKQPTAPLSPLSAVSKLVSMNTAPLSAAPVEGGVGVAGAEGAAVGNGVGDGVEVGVATSQDPARP